MYSDYVKSYFELQQNLFKEQIYRIKWKASFDQS